MPLLLAYLAGDHPPATQTSAGDFIKAIITISANASQNEQSCIGPNNLTRQLVSEACIESLISDMLRGGNPLTVGVGIIIEVIRKNNSDYDPDVGAGADSIPSSNDPIYLGTLLRLFAKHVPDFTNLILSPNHTVPNGEGTMIIKRKELNVAFGTRIEPLGFDRFKTCELMAELLHCSNMGLLNERGSEAFVKQRDQERERLKAEGSLLAGREPQSAVTDFSEESTAFHNGASPSGLGSKSSERNRRLEVANSADEDGFEDVGASADLADEIKDDFEINPSYELESKPAQMPSLLKNAKPRLDLDEDFVDEPLTSPRLEALDERETELPENSDIFNDLETELEHEPHSPTSDLATGINSLTIGHDTPTGGDDVSHLAELPVESTTNELPPQYVHPEAPPLPHRDRLLDPNPAEYDSPRDLSPHPDDKPAPLFASKSEQIPPDAGPSHKAVDPNIGGGSSQGTIDTTVGEEGDSNRSILMSNEQKFSPHIENDVDGQPMVGDFLKMMFVEHEVVPTILVRKYFH